MNEMSHLLAGAVRSFVDLQTEKVAETTPARIIATVLSVQAGAASDGNAIVTVRWRGNEVTCEGYAASYTPVAGNRVACDLIDSQLLIAYKAVGKP